MTFHITNSDTKNNRSAGNVLQSGLQSMMIRAQPVWAFACYCLPLTSALLRSAIQLLLLMLQLDTIVLPLLLIADA